MVKQLLWAGLLGLAGCQTSRPQSPTGIYKTAAAFRQRQPSLAGLNAGKVFLARKVYVVNAPGSGERRTKVSLDSVWGYAGSNHVAYRLYKHAAYEVEQADTLSIYSRLTSNGKTQQRIYFFSQGLTGPVQRLSKKYLKQAYADNPRFLDPLASMKWYHSLAFYESPPAGPRSFRVVALYRQSLGMPATYAH
ncbi:hypothetical protein GKZ68_02615 [Hymenobacter sp. BRD128]|uniref:hypothetical protein n=1 Tax=Hymenobacter sp. BRD128 TaxID=2675878 RepID=UPI0015646D96|nr:hypothetical protein [Hymenobacter sp. BRD128]QKG55625.1 hypothetical protein GKZ68_02615 [Hymenobacter sp. BRD128]